jgi:hypothetical protein
MRYIVGIAVLVVVISVAGCTRGKNTPTPSTLSNVGIRTSYNPSVQYPKGAHFAFVQNAKANEGDEEETRIARRIQTALTNELTKKGYKPGEYEEIDFFVGYSLGLRHEIEVLVAKSKSQGSEWMTAIVTPDDYVTGALLVQIIDAKKMEPVWLGVFNADVALDSIGERDKQERADYAVGELLKLYPPK